MAYELISQSNKLNERDGMSNKSGREGEGPRVTAYQQRL